MLKNYTLKWFRSFCLNNNYSNFTIYNNYNKINPKKKIIWQKGQSLRCQVMVSVK